MARFFIGLGLGVLLTVYALALVGVGHGTAVPIVMTFPLSVVLTEWGAVPALAIGPLLWGCYFLFVPRIPSRGRRKLVTVVIIFIHILAGIWLGVQDPAFARALREQRMGLVGFGLLLTITVSCFSYVSTRRS